MPYKKKSKSLEKKFNDVLQSAKKALDAVNIPFHFHSGTALGAHREKSFIAHDHDIDLSVFSKDVKTKETEKKLIKSMKENGFTVKTKLGKLSRGREIQFEKNDVPLDILWTYPGKYRGKDYYIYTTYYGMCNDLKYEQCVWSLRPYKTEKIKFLGETYDTFPTKSLVDMYGKDWNVVKKFNYWQGLDGGYKGFLKDYYNPIKTDKKIAFCFLTYSGIDHNDLWVKFFKKDNYPIKRYSIYSHVKKVTKDTPPWIKDNMISTLPTRWCGPNLAFAFVNMLKKALKDKDNKYFTILSGSCIPIYNFDTAYKKITRSKKSRMDFDRNSNIFRKAGLYWGSQWLILNRKCAEILVSMTETPEGKKFTKGIEDILARGNPSCPDELFPINWFIKKLGKPSSSKFKKLINNKPSTYVLWESGANHPVKFNLKKARQYRKKIYDSDALFARKFTKGAADYISKV
jgi:hypothetical protein